MCVWVLITNMYNNHMETSMIFPNKYDLMQMYYHHHRYKIKKFPIFNNDKFYGKWKETIFLT